MKVRYSQVRLLCMFDLPIETKEEQKAYRKFRKTLIENGFNMLQYSIYYRVLPNKTALSKYESVIKKAVPRNGNVRLIYVTETQYQNMKLLVGNRSYQEEIVGINRMVII